MTTKSVVFRFIAACWLGLLTGCSGGNVSLDISGPDISPDWLPWADEAITVYGANTGQGEVIVNSIGFAANRATVTINGRPGTVSGLRPGQVIMIDGQVYGGRLWGTADHIDYDARLVGPVEMLDASNRRLVAMGQAVVCDPETVFGTGIDSVDFAGLSIGSNIEVSGYARADGAIRATRIDSVADDADVQLIGEVTDLDLATLRFRVTGLIADYSAAQVIDLPGGAPIDGMTVRMTGASSGGRFAVATLASASTPTGVTGQRVQAAGLVTRFYSVRDFYVNHFATATSFTTAFRNGDEADLAPNAEVVIDGYAASNGRIMADRVTFLR